MSNQINQPSQRPRNGGVTGRPQAMGAAEAASHRFASHRQSPAAKSSIIRPAGLKGLVLLATPLPSIHRSTCNSFTARPTLRGAINARGEGLAMRIRKIGSWER